MDLSEGDLDEEQALRSILVSNIPQYMTYKDVIIHFQKERNGGGEVDSVRFPDATDSSTVVVTFDEPSTVESALIREHKINGNDVTVQRYPKQVVIPEVFENVQARVNPEIFGSDETLCEVVQYLRSEFGVECKNSRSSNCFYLTGTLQQITCCHGYLLEVISIQGNCRGPGNKLMENNFQTIPIICKFLFAVSKYKKLLKHIERECHVMIQPKDNHSQVFIQELPGCSKKTFDEGIEKFVQLYQMMLSESMLSKEVLLKPDEDTPSFTAKEAVEEVQQNTPVVIEKTHVPDEWLFYGEHSQVNKAINDVCNILKIRNPLKRSTRYHTSSNNKTGNTTVKPSESLTAHASQHLNPSAISDNQANPYTLTDKRQPLEEEFLTKKGYRLTVKMADITEENVDVIVNCNDGMLKSFPTGLSYTIVKKGGNGILDEVESQLKKRKVSPGKILISSGGKLNCCKIMHVIMYNGSKSKDQQKSFITDACLNGLRKAQSMRYRSIAFPVIATFKGSRLPLPNCSVAMINAVEQYMTKSDPKQDSSTVVDIRFVHLDKSAFEVFVIELKKRYGSSHSRKVKPDEPTSKPSGNGGIIGDKKEKEECPICLDEFNDPISLQKCKHQFCRPCIDEAFKLKKVCPTCNTPYGEQKGTMPPGTMNYSFDHYIGIPGYGPGAIIITYDIYGGTQGPEHPNPGQRYTGTHRVAYLPYNDEGKEVLQLLRRAFDARLTFTIGTSVTTGCPNTVTWNDIHHKTSIHGGPTGYGYPDPGYLKRVKDELAAKGIS